MIAVIDYGVGNLFSLDGFAQVSGSGGCRLTGEKEEIEAADRIILPGVGAFADAIGEAAMRRVWWRPSLDADGKGQAASWDLPGYAAACLRRVMNTACTRAWDSSRGRSHLLMKI